MDKLNLEYDIISDISRPTEDTAFNRIKLQEKFLFLFNKTKRDHILMIRVVELERKFMTGGDDNEIAVMKIAGLHSISEDKVKKILNTYTLFEYYRFLYLDK